MCNETGGRPAREARMSERVVVVGGGQAAAQLAQSLRQAKFAGGIRIIGDERFAPYQRPPLSKKFLHDRPPPDSLYFRPPAFWESQGVALDLGRAVAEIAPREKRVTLA